MSVKFEDVTKKQIWSLKQGISFSKFSKTKLHIETFILHAI
jgi:hypothetical protein